MWRYAVCAQSMETEEGCKYQSMPYNEIILSVMNAIDQHEYIDAEGNTLKEIKALEERAGLLSAKIDFHTDFKGTNGKKQYAEALSEFDQVQRRLVELKESRSPLSARLFKSTKEAILKNRTCVTNNLLRQLIHRVDLDFPKRTLVVHFNDNGKEGVGLDDFRDGYDNPPGWSEIKKSRIKSK